MIVRPEITKTQKTGAMFRLTLGGPDYEVEVERAPDNAGAPDTANSVFFTLAAGTTVWLDELPADNAYRHWRFRHIGTDVNPSAWTAWVKARPALYLLDDFNRPAVWTRPQRGESYTDGKFSTQAKEQTGTVLVSAVGQDDGVGTRILVKGHQAGTGRHGDAVTFGTPFQVAPPMVLVAGGISHEPRNAQWSNGLNTALPQYEERGAVNVSASGFTLRGLLRQKAAPTARTADFPAGGAGLVQAVGSGSAIQANLANAPSATDQYTVHYKVTLTLLSLGLSGSATVWVTLRTNDGGGWVDRLTVPYSADLDSGNDEQVWAHEQKVLSVAGLGVDDDVALYVSAIQSSGELTDSDWSFVVEGFNLATDADPSAGVTYQTATDSLASMTPDTEDRLAWEAMAGS